MFAAAGHPDENNRSEPRRLSDPESGTVAARPVVNRATQPWTDACANADKERNSADYRAERLAVK